MSVAAAILVKVIHRTNRQCVLASVPQIDVMLEQKTVGPSAGEAGRMISGGRFIQDEHTCTKEHQEREITTAGAGKLNR